MGGGGGGPSGSRLPGALAGWRQVLADDFNGTQLNGGVWGTYEGQPGGEPGAWWDPSHVVVHNGLLELQSYRDARFGGRWVSGGLSSARALTQTYGKYLVRFRIDEGYEIGSTILLMGHNQWPPEIDFAENGGEDRGHMDGVVHYSAQDHRVLQTVQADFTTWHTVGVEWTPQHVAFTLDGTTWATVDGAAVPTEPMDFDIQTQAGTCRNGTGCPDSRTPAQVNMQIDWVAVYAPA